MKTHVEKLKEEYTNIDTMFSNNDIICLNDTCEAILKDIDELNYKCHCKDIIKDLIKRGLK